MSETSSGRTAAARASAAARSVAAGHELVPGAVVLCRRAPARCAAGRAVASRSQFGGPVGPEELAHRDQQRRFGAGQDVGGLAGGVSGVQRDDNARPRSAWPGRRPPSARCSATRWPPGRRRAHRGRSSPRRPGAPRRAARRRSVSFFAVTSASWSGSSTAIRSSTAEWSAGGRHRCSSGLIARLLVDRCALTKQVLGRLAYRDGWRSRSSGREVRRVAGRQSGRRIRSAQRPRRAGP